ncbi:hypothetical protein FRC10_009210 [Ceratobasidium sp. 414]|nr:hypothetical protein FRC10_009210 [Ceratobasidium sp. 414]
MFYINHHHLVAFGPTNTAAIDQQYYRDTIVRTPMMFAYPLIYAYTVVYGTAFVVLLVYSIIISTIVLSFNSRFISHLCLTLFALVKEIAPECIYHNLMGIDLGFSGENPIVTLSAMHAHTVRKTKDFHLAFHLRIVQSRPPQRSYNEAYSLLKSLIIHVEYDDIDFDNPNLDMDAEAAAADAAEAAPANGTTDESLPMPLFLTPN